MSVACGLARIASICAVTLTVKEVMDVRAEVMSEGLSAALTGTSAAASRGSEQVKNFMMGV